MLPVGRVLQVASRLVVLMVVLMVRVPQAVHRVKANHPKIKRGSFCVQLDL